MRHTLQPAKVRSSPGPKRGIVATVVASSVVGAALWGYVERTSQWIDLSAPVGSLHVRFANNASDRSLGLSRRDALPADGLLLQWEGPGRHPIWMMDMRFPLDVIWLERDGAVTGLLGNLPACGSPTCPLYEPNGTERSVAVLELAAGAAAKHDIEMGAVIRGIPSSASAR